MNNNLPVVKSDSNTSTLILFETHKNRHKEAEKILESIRSYTVKTGDLTGNSYGIIKSILGGGGAGGGLSLVTAEMTLAEAGTAILGAAGVEIEGSAIASYLGAAANMKVAALGGVGVLVVGLAASLVISSIKSERAQRLAELFAQCSFHIVNLTNDSFMSMQEGIARDAKTVVDLKAENKEIKADLDEVRQHLGLNKRSSSFSDMVDQSNNEVIGRRI